MSPSESADDNQVWLFMRPGSVPQRWKERAVPTCLVPLLPAEADELLSGVALGVGNEDRALVRLVAKGLSTEDIARELGVSFRSVQRRLAALRERYGVGSRAELVSLLARRGLAE